MPDPTPRPTASRTERLARLDIANRLFFRLYQASNLMHKTGSRAIGAYGTTTQQWAVLGALSRPGTAEQGMTVKELIGFLMVSRQSLTAVLNRLARSGLIERARGTEDGRIRRIRLTLEGTQTWARMQAEIAAFYAAALSEFTTDESVMLFRLLDRLKIALSRL